MSAITKPVTKGTSARLTGALSGPAFEYAVVIVVTGTWLLSGAVWADSGVWNDAATWSD